MNAGGPIARPVTLSLATRDAVSRMAARRRNRGSVHAGWSKLTYWVYILACGRHGTVYVGVTNSLERRIAQHRAREVPGFTATYGVDRLVWFQGFGDVGDAIYLEKRLKRWRREWKVRLIEERNPYWRDLAAELG